MPDHRPSTGERTMLAALRAGTPEHHHAVERVLDLPGRVRDRRDLVIVLDAMLAAWQPVEERLATAYDWGRLGLDPRLGAAADLLRADLALLADDPPAGRGPAPGDLPALGGAAAAVGGRYVLVGSALGGRVIAPVIERRLGLPEGRGTGFFRRAGRTPDADWRAFRTAVDRRAWSAPERAEAVRAARETFAVIARTAAAAFAARPTTARPRAR
ncbi:biliverdin-producing heme oxygenase [Micromonospora sp. PLK6-60]|uniref:biliverdin-producing heme oxygenase n=1 Tax=Micromonospora sp. PLK6-60 TaxID=2873383 RepID=UPI001CA7080A|nr:biliverdin-producing heme oxygenase [Micromonospora sp. PLK6-60]MBY8873785.1 biliverdin-producing heme oxygenase [Micromonospora sp. PLK6-60]